MPAVISVGGRLLLQYLLIVLLVAAAWRVARRLVGDALGPRMMAAALIFFSVNVVLIAVPGLAGWLTAPVVLLLACSYLLAVFYWIRPGTPGSATVVMAATEHRPVSERPPVMDRFRRPLISHAAWLALPFVLVTIPHLLRAVLLVPIDWDSHCYHLFLPTHWIQQHRISVLDLPTPYTSFNFYAKNFECTLTLSMIVAANDLLAKWFAWPCIALCGLATGLICQRLGGHRLACWSSAAIVLTSPCIVIMTDTTKPDPMVIFSMLSALWLVLCVIQKSGPARRLLFLAGLAAGLAIGGKPTALPPILVLCLAVPFAAASAMRTWRGTAEATLLFGLAILLTGSWWYGWNYWITGNPVYPASLGPFVGIQDPVWSVNILNRLYKLSWFWSIWDGTYYKGRSGWHQAFMTYGLKFGLLFALLVVALAGGLLRAGLLLRRRAVADALVWVLTLSCMLAATYAYLRAPYWRFSYVASVVRISLPAILMGCAAGTALLSRLRVHPACYWVVPLLGTAVDFQFIDVRVPEPIWLTVLVAAVGLGMCYGLRARKLAPWAAVLVLGLLLPVLQDFRETHRYEHYENWWEAHPSGFQRFATGAAWLQSTHPNEPVAVAFGTAFEFLYLYVAPNLERPVHYISTAKRIVPSWKSNGELRAKPDVAAWREHVAHSDDKYLICHQWTTASWPPEREWAQQAHFPLLFWTHDVEIYELPGRSAREPDLTASRVLLDSKD